MKIILFLQKTFIFLKKHILSEPFFVLLYGLAYFKKDYATGVKIMDVETMLKEVFKGKSLIRLGDGEVALIKMIDIHFQKAEEKLSKELKQIVLEYSKSSAYVLAIPTRYINQSNTDLKKINLFRCWLPFKVAFKQYFPQNIDYADAHAFYVKNFFENNMPEYLNKKYVIVCTRNYTIKKQKKNIEKYISVKKWIETPETNSYGSIFSIKKEIESEVLKLETLGYKKTDVCILISSGPMSKVLSYDLSNENIQAIDMGHGLEVLYDKDSNLEKVLV